MDLDSDKELRMMARYTSTHDLLNKRMILLGFLAILLMAVPAWAQRPVEVVLHTAEAGNVSGTTPTVTGFLSATVQITVAGGFDGTLTYGVSTDGTNYTTVLCRDSSTGNIATTATAAGTFVCPIVGADLFRAIISGRTVGTVTATAQFVGTGSGFPVVSSTVAPAASACKTITTNAQGVANATITVDATAGGITVMAASTTRCGGIIQNESGGDMRCATGALAPTTTVGMLVGVGQTLQVGLEGQQQMRCIRTGATSATVSVMEETL